jgi:hypothetical protein
VAKINDDDPILLLSERALQLFHGQPYGVVIAALAGALGFVLDHGESTRDEPLAATQLRNDLKQLVAEILHHRDTSRTRTRES